MCVCFSGGRLLVCVVYFCGCLEVSCFFSFCYNVIIFKNYY